RLPPEVLTRVFRFNALLEPHGIQRSISSTRQTEVGWIKVTYVCHFWRQVALGEPTLWADVDVGLGQEWTTVFLARSKAVPIRVK
ncbi:hypothetical protein BV25DRAFT_1789775, partial [Artomyces pyxidatus]